MNFSIRGKLFASFGTLIALMAGVGFIGWRNTSEIAAYSESLYRDQLTGAVALANAESALWKLRYGFPQFIVQPEKRSDILAEEPKLYKAVEENLKAYSVGKLTPEEQKAYQELEAIYQKYILARPKWFELIQQGKTQEAADYRAATTTPFGGGTVKGLNNLINLQREVGTKKHQEIQAQVQLMTNLLIIVLAVALLCGLLLTLLVSRSITRPVLRSVNKIASSSTGIATTVEQQERTVSHQASSVSQTTTTMEELGASSQQSAEQAEASAAAARQALSLAENGNKSVERTMSGMVTLKQKVGAIAEQILRLSEQTNQIASISGLVGDLANQTNMLALNAAVEAARAGEHGKGFNVVAGEIRKLADQSKKSAEKINALVIDIQAAINTTVMVTDEGTKTVDEGIKQAQGTAESFTGVADAIDNVFVNSQQISLSAKQQAIAVQQVLDAMSSVNLGAKETASGISQVKDSTEQLNAAAAQLKKMAEELFLASAA